MASDLQTNIDATIQDTSSPIQNAADQANQTSVPTGPIYKLDPTTKVPVSFHEGAMWKSRQQAGLKLMAGLYESWKEAEAYYSNSQMEHRRATEGQWKGNNTVSKNRNRKFSSTENIVYSTINAEIPSIYAKNPNVDFTAGDKSEEELATGLKHFCNNLAARKDAPGINLKPKIRKSTMRASLTNEAWVMFGWVQKEFSAENAREEIDRIGQALTKAEDQKEVEKLEGELMALEESCDLLDPAGPFVKTVRGDQVIVDMASVEDDHSDANWIMVRVMFQTAYLNARYRQVNPQDPEGKQFVSAYKATHVVDASTQGSGVGEEQRDIDNFHIFDAGKDNPNDYGYSDRNSYERSKMTAVWYCFDKVKRRFYLYADNDWTWPVWVFNDPYHLPGFYPLVKLMYHTDPRKNRTRGEVSHYLDQQDELNTISDELNRCRTQVRDKVLFDPEMLDQATVENLMDNPNRKAVPVKGLKEGIEKAISAPPLPNLQYPHLWDRAPAMAVINQVSGIGDAQRGEQFKTNTTNQAIEFYSSVSGVRLDEKRDAVEDFIGEIMHGVLFLCLQYMPAEQFVEIAGSQYADSFQGFSGNYEPSQIRRMMNIRIEGGSTQKPTSAAKKAEALQIGQILGQFARMTPYAGIVALEVMEESFDSITIEAADWEKIEQQAEMALMQGNNAPGLAQSSQGDGNPQDQEAQMIQQVMQRAQAAGTPITENQARQAIQKRLGQGGQDNQQTH